MNPFLKTIGYVVYARPDGARVRLPVRHNVEEDLVAAAQDAAVALDRMATAFEVMKLEMMWHGFPYDDD